MRNPIIKQKNLSKLVLTLSCAALAACSSGGGGSANKNTSANNNGGTNNSSQPSWHIFTGKEQETVPNGTGNYIQDKLYITNGTASGTKELKSQLRYTGRLTQVEQYTYFLAEKYAYLTAPSATSGYKKIENQTLYVTGGTKSGTKPLINPTFGNNRNTAITNYRGQFSRINNKLYVLEQQVEPQPGSPIITYGDLNLYEVQGKSINKIKTFGDVSFYMANAIYPGPQPCKYYGPKLFSDGKRLFLSTNFTHPMYGGVSSTANPRTPLNQRIFAFNFTNKSWVRLIDNRTINNGAPPISYKNNLIYKGNTSYFVANRELYASDGTTLGTQQVAISGIHTQANLGLFKLGNRAFVLITSGASGLKLYELDNNTATRVGITYPAGITASDVRTSGFEALVVTGNKLVFTLQTVQNGPFILESDGTLSQMTLNDNTYTKIGYSSSPDLGHRAPLYVRGKKLLFRGLVTNASGLKSHALLVGDLDSKKVTVISKTSVSDFAHSTTYAGMRPRVLGFVSDNKAVFIGTDGNKSNRHGNEVWQTDFSEAGTSILKDILAGKDSGAAFHMGTSP